MRLPSQPPHDRPSQGSARRQVAWLVEVARGSVVVRGLTLRGQVALSGAEPIERVGYAAVYTFAKERGVEFHVLA